MRDLFADSPVTWTAPLKIWSALTRITCSQAFVDWLVIQNSPPISAKTRSSAPIRRCVVIHPVVFDNSNSAAGCGRSLSTSCAATLAAKAVVLNKVNCQLTVPLMQAPNQNLVSSILPTNNGGVLNSPTFPLVNALRSCSDTWAGSPTQKSLRRPNDRSEALSLMCIEVLPC